MGMAGKVRPVVILTREDPTSPRAISVVVPLTTQSRGTKYEVQMPRVPWLKHLSHANVQALSSYEHHEFLERRGRFETVAMEKIKEAVRWALEL